MTNEQLLVIDKVKRLFTNIKNKRFEVQLVQMIDNLIGGYLIEDSRFDQDTFKGLIFA